MMGLSTSRKILRSVSPVYTQVNVLRITSTYFEHLGDPIRDRVWRVVVFSFFLNKHKLADFELFAGNLNGRISIVVTDVRKSSDMTC